MKTYFNEQGDILYTLHLPGDHYIEAFQQLRNNNKERIIHKSNNITVISIMTRDCWEKSLVREQCEFIYRNYRDSSNPKRIKVYMYRNSAWDKLFPNTYTEMDFNKLSSGNGYEDVSYNVIIYNNYEGQI